MPPVNKKPAAPTPEAADERPVIHPTVYCIVCDGDTSQPSHGEPLTVQKAKDLLGWTVVTEGTPLLVDEEKNKIVCRNNQSNRPFDESRADQYAQDVLCRKWAGPHGNGRTVNGEAMVVGKYGQTLSCQHRLIALVLAGQRWAKDDHWRQNWPAEPVMDSVVTFGVDESSETTITIDNVKPRTAADVFYADPSFFPKNTSAERKLMCKTLDYSVKFDWYRTGAKNDAYSPRRTHSEAKEFIALHPRILRCVKHICETDDENSISRVVPLGVAAGLMYLMGSANTEPSAYHGPDVMDPSEELLDWTLWDKAHDFWVNLSNNEIPGFKRVVMCIKDMGRLSGDGGAPTPARIGVVVKAWQLWAGDTPMTYQNLGYVYEEKKDPDSKLPLKYLVSNGLKYKPEQPDPDAKLDECPSCGGIDLGDPDEALAEAKAKAKEERDAEQQRIKDAAKLVKSQLNSKAKLPPEETMGDAIDRIRRENPGMMLTFRGPDDTRNLWGNDAVLAAKILGKETALVDGLQKLTIVKGDIDAEMTKLIKAKHSPGVCGKGADGKAVYLGDYTPGGWLDKPTDPSPKPAPPVMSTKEQQAIKARAEKVKAESLAEKKGAPSPKTAPKSKLASKPALKGGI